MSERFELNKQTVTCLEFYRWLAILNKDVGTSLGSMKTIGWPSRGPGYPFEQTFVIDG